MIELSALYGRQQVRVQVQRRLAELRQLAAPPEEGELVQSLEAEVRQRLEASLGCPVQRVLNATGILLHTNLGRAPLPRWVALALPALLDAYCDLEMDLASGRRDDRNRRAGGLLCALTGAEAALVANNNAGALLLALSCLASGREVLVSRGELVEIGGSFRIPDILAASGARLVEVGTTNRTRLADYEARIGPDTALLLKVFPSNYQIRGFTAAVSGDQLAALGKRTGIPVLVDEGSGLLRRHPAPQLADHPSMSELLAAGCDLVCGSGDKLLGGPQAGLLAGRRDLVERCRRHPLYRPLRPDRTAFAALEGVLRLHLNGAPLPLDGLWPDFAVHRRRLEAAAEHLGAQIVHADAFLGGGSAPDRPIAGHALALPDDPALAERLRRGQPPVVGYQRDGHLILDLRTVDPLDDELLIATVRTALGR